MKSAQYSIIQRNDPSIYANGHQRSHLVSRYKIHVNNKTAPITILGENNAGYNRDKYNCTFPKMIEDWRNVRYTRTNSTTDPQFPFGFVQVNSM